MKQSINKISGYTKNRFKSIFNSDLTSQQIALNFTVGILIGLIIPMGLQTIAVVLLCGIFKLNLVIVVFATLISNPFTVIFIYYSAFKLGDFFMQSGISWSLINDVLNNPNFNSILNISFDGIKVIYTGLFLESLLLCTFTYFFILYISKYIKNRRMQGISIIADE